VFYKGNFISLENQYPLTLQAHYHSLAYVNQMGNLKIVTEGNVYEVANNVEAYKLNYDVLTYQFAANVYRVFYKGVSY
jgi:hypothetical protein